MIEAGRCDGREERKQMTETETGAGPLTRIPFARPDGEAATLDDYRGRVVLIVNTASKCGLTPQYESLQRLYEEQRDSGLTVLAFPANDFMGQEPGSDEEIAEFCSTQYAVTFPVMSKISVTGEEQHPLYAELTRLWPEAEGKREFREGLRANGLTPTEDPEVIWNFEKFLVSRSGEVVGRFAPTTTVDDPGVRGAIERELGAGGPGSDSLPS